MQGYLDNPKATAEIIDTKGYLHTGDIGYVDKLGNWFIVDRCKELIKFNAFQIAPAELENVLLDCPLVADAAVIGIYDEGRQTEVPRAYITLSPTKVKMMSEAQTMKEIHTFVNANVVHYKQLRGGIEFIEVVPKSVSGKILRKDLRELYKKKQQMSKAKL
jgi:acyl-CoA synthetase (AMP-forming)/AMP-acid ligase II